jgi:hypothetical protein
MQRNFTTRRRALPHPRPQSASSRLSSATPGQARWLLASCTRAFGLTGTDQVCSSGFKIFGCFEIADQSVLEKKISNREFSENSIIEKKGF